MSQIVLDRKRFTCYGGATNGSFTASSETNLELISGHSTGATFDIEGYSGVTSCTISAGVYDIVLHIPQWDGTGEVSSKSNRTFNLQFNGGLSPLIVQTPAVNLDSIGGAYLGSSAVTAVYIGADLMFSARTAYSTPDVTLHVTGVPQVGMHESMDYHFDSSMTSDSWNIQFNYNDNATVINTSNVGDRWTVTNYNSGAGTFDIVGPFLPYGDTSAEYRVYTEVTNEDGSCTTEPETITFPGGTTAFTATFPYCRPDNSGGGGDGPDDPGGDEDF